MPALDWFHALHTLSCQRCPSCEQPHAQRLEKRLQLKCTRRLPVKRAPPLSGIPISKGQDPGQFSNFGLGSIAASYVAGEPTTGNDQHVSDSRTKDAGNPLPSATQNLHTSHDESAGDNLRPDFSVPPENPKITPAKTPAAGTSACTGSVAQNALESATPHATPVSDARHPAGFGLIS